MRRIRTPLLLLGFAGLSMLGVLASACVPDSFTYGEGGGGGSSTSGGGVCGDGELQGAEECDLGIANADDHVDVSLDDSDASRGCSTECRRVVQWSQVVGSGAIDRQSVALGLAVNATNVFVGGAVDDPDPLDFNTVRLSARRLYTRLSPVDASQLTSAPIVDRDLDAEGNAIFALVPGTNADEVYALESFHDAGVTVQSHVRFRSNEATLWDSPPVAKPETSAAALGLRDTAGRVLAVGPDFGNSPVLTRIAGDGLTVTTDDLGLAAGWNGYGPAAVAPVYDGGALVVWEHQAVRVGDTGVGVLFSEDLDALLGFDVSITGICALGADRFAMAGWAVVDGGYDGLLIVVDDQLRLLGQALFDGEAGGGDVFRGMACDGTDSVVVTGEESTLADAAAAPLELRHSRVVTQRYAISASGEPSVRWTRSYASPVTSADGTFAGNDGFAVAVAPDGFVYVAGRKQVSQTLASAWVRKYAP